MANFVYVVGSMRSRQALVIDPAWDIDAILRTLDADGMMLTGAIVTHYHPDHCGGHLWGHDIQGVAEVAAKRPVPIYVHKLDCEGVIKLTGLSAKDLTPVESGHVFELDGVHVRLIHTPGHTPGSQCVLIEESKGHSLISGDTLFISGCGRVDLPGGNSEQLYHSLSDKIAKLKKDTVIYPGHRYDPVDFASLEHVMRVNPYLQVKSFQEWDDIR